MLCSGVSCVLFLRGAWSYLCENKNSTRAFFINCVQGLDLTGFKNLLGLEQTNYQLINIHT